MLTIMRCYNNMMLVLKNFMMSPFLYCFLILFSFHRLLLLLLLLLLFLLLSLLLLLLLERRARS